MTLSSNARNSLIQMFLAMRRLTTLGTCLLTKKELILITLEHKKQQLQKVVKSMKHSDREPVVMKWSKLIMQPMDRSNHTFRQIYSIDPSANKLLTQANQNQPLLQITIFQEGRPKLLNKQCLHLMIQLLVNQLWLDIINKKMQGQKFMNFRYPGLVQI